MVRRGIENHLLDSSPAVRDAAVELIGKYMIDSPEVAGDYYQKIADRIAVRSLAIFYERTIFIICLGHRPQCTETRDQTPKIILHRHSG